MTPLNPNVPPHTIAANRLKALVLDWAGTTVDFGSLAPARTIHRVFESVGISLSEDEVRRDMGLAKKDHIARILAMPRVRDAWRAVRGNVPTPDEADVFYEMFVPLQLSCLAEYSTLIPGVIESVQRFRRRGLKIGSTTGYTREMLDLLVETSAQAGYKPDCSVSPEDVGSARPSPFMLYENAVRLQVYPMASIAKVGDTPADIQEGLNAGAWSIGVAATGNAVGLSYSEFQALSTKERDARVSNARAELQGAGAHYVVETLANLDSVLDDIDARLKSADGSLLPLREGT
ncbi:MAG TPA: phosphonoacetaldehyde hydrolase [Candidatus Acidoferrum sp.]|nr:phosphonoacetaldehyde hydrolase [Candidatus Acidoferrum sp.]